MKRTFGLVMGVIAALGLGVGSVAADYPTGVPTVGASNSTPKAGQPFTLTATNFNPGSLVTFTGSTLGSAIADSVGTASITVNARTKTGPWVITATCSLPCTRTATITVNVQAPTKIPRTGSDSTATTIQLGAVAVVSGGALIGLAALRRRRLVAA